jgi:predicted NBD/HSP70 family sugar kinase
VGVPPIVNSTLKQLKQNPNSSLNNHQISIEKITSAALQHDPLAVDVIRTAGEYLGISIANLLNLVNPELIILGGDLIEAGDIFMDAVRSTAFTRSISKAANEVTIISSDLKQNVISIGAATLVIYFAFLPTNIRYTLNIL